MDFLDKKNHYIILALIPAIVMAFIYSMDFVERLDGGQATGIWNVAGFIIIPFTTLAYLITSLYTSIVSLIYRQFNSIILMLLNIAVIISFLALFKIFTIFNLNLDDNAGFIFNQIKSYLLVSTWLIFAFGVALDFFGKSLKRHVISLLAFGLAAYLSAVLVSPITFEDLKSLTVEEHIPPAMVSSATIGTCFETTSTVYSKSLADKYNLPLEFVHDLDEGVAVMEVQKYTCKNKVKTKDRRWCKQKGSKFDELSGECEVMRTIKRCNVNAFVDSTLNIRHYYNDEKIGTTSVDKKLITSEDVHSKEESYLNNSESSKRFTQLADYLTLNHVKPEVRYYTPAVGGGGYIHSHMNVYVPSIIDGYNYYSARKECRNLFRVSLSSKKKQLSAQRADYMKDNTRKELRKMPFEKDKCCYHWELPKRLLKAFASDKK
ncbi:MAG: hypothetical protein ACI9TY_000504 [Alphaproteobacteria bacterium]|jgi:hypothetical protein